MASEAEGQGAEADLSCGLEISSPVLEGRKGSMVPQEGSRFHRETLVSPEKPRSQVWQGSSSGLCEYNMHGDCVDRGDGHLFPGWVDDW